MKLDVVFCYLNTEKHFKSKIVVKTSIAYLVIAAVYQPQL